MTSPISELSDDEIRKILNVGATFAAIQVAIDVLEKAAIDDDDAEAIGWLPLELRLHTVARLLDAADGIREELREIDAQLLSLTGGEPVAPSVDGTTEP